MPKLLTLGNKKKNQIFLLYCTRFFVTLPKTTNHYKQ